MKEWRSKCNSIDDFRLETFLEKYKQFSKKSSKNETILKIKKLYGSSLPPCTRVLVQKIKRTMLFARQWRCSCIQFLPTSEPYEYGWKLENNKYQIEWFKGQACPRVMNILDIDEVDLGKLSTTLLIQYLI